MFQPRFLSANIYECFNLETNPFLSLQNRVNTVSIRPTPATDESLCARLREGEVAALHQLMAHHGPAVRKLARNVLNDEAEAEDVAQEVFLVVWKHRQSWSEGAAKFSTWLHRVALNKAIDRRRARRCSPETVETITSLCDAMTPVSAHGPQEADLSQRESAAALRGAMRSLPANQARALSLFYFEECEVPRIAAAMGLTEQAVRSLLKRGKQALRACLVGRTADDEASSISNPAGRAWAGRR